MKILFVIVSNGPMEIVKSSEFQFYESVNLSARTGGSQEDWNMVSWENTERLICEVQPQLREKMVGKMLGMGEGRSGGEAA